MPILPIAEFEQDLAQQDRETYERLKPPSSVVVRFGVMKMIGEFPYALDEKPGCGTRFVLKTHRGTEIGEMLTSTCPNSGCGKSISRKEMLEYIDRSGGKDFPFFSMQGKVLRVATVEDLNQQTRIDETRPKMIRHAREVVSRLNLPMKVVDAEPILGGEKVTFYFVSEERIDFRELVHELAQEHQTRIEMRQVGSRDEARLTADYEKCGQHCCCKQFLKVLKPVSMKNAKIQKATLDPLKISGRCGRLMCCLRYEEATYDDLRARLPKKRTRVQGEFGTGIVLDTQILTQLCLVLIDGSEETAAVALEELTILGPGAPPAPAQAGGAGPSAPPARPRKPDVEREDPDHTDEGLNEEHPPVSHGSRPEDGVEAREDRAPVQQPDAPPAVPPRAPHGQETPRQTGGQQGGGGGRPGGGQQRPQSQQGRPQDRRPMGPAGPGGGGGRPQGDQRRQGGQPQARPPQQSQRGQQPPRPPQPQPRPEPRDEIDDILSGMETDIGDGRGNRPRGEPESGPGGGGGGGGGGRKRKRKRRRGGGGPDGGGSGPNSSESNPPSSPSPGGG